MSVLDKQNRFQYQPWYIKLWRLRYYLPIPFMAVRFWLYERKRELEDEDDWRDSFSNMWSIAKGMAHHKMHWVYDWEEIREDLMRKYNIEENNEGR